MEANNVSVILKVFEPCRYLLVFDCPLCVPHRIEVRGVKTKAIISKAHFSGSKEGRKTKIDCVLVTFFLNRPFTTQIYIKRDSDRAAASKASVPTKAKKSGRNTKKDL